MNDKNEELPHVPFELRSRVGDLIRLAAEQYLYAPRLNLPGAVSRVARKRICDACDELDDWRGRGMLVSLALWGHEFVGQAAQIRKVAPSTGLPEAIAAFKDTAGAGKKQKVIQKAMGPAKNFKGVDLPELLRGSGAAKGRGLDDSAAPSVFYAAWRLEDELRKALEETGRRIRKAWQAGEEPAEEVDRLLRLLRWWWVPAGREPSTADGGRYGLVVKGSELVPVKFGKWITAARCQAIAACGPALLEATGPQAAVKELMDAVGGDLMLSSLVARFVFGGMIASPTALGNRLAATVIAQAERLFRGGSGPHAFSAEALPALNAIRKAALERAHDTAKDYGVEPYELDMALATSSFCWDPADGRPDHAFKCDAKAGTLDVDTDASPRPIGLVVHGLVQGINNPQHERLHALALSVLGHSHTTSHSTRLKYMMKLGWIQCNPENIDNLTELFIGK